MMRSTCAAILFVVLAGAAFANPTTKAPATKPATKGSGK